MDRRAIFVQPVFLPPDACRDPKDVKYLEAVQAASADFLISSDKDLLVLKRWQSTQIVTPDQFLKTYYHTKGFIDKI